MLLKSISENILMPYNHIVVMIKSAQHQEWYIERVFFLYLLLDYRWFVTSDNYLRKKKNK